MTYSTRHLVYLALLMLLSHARSRRQFNRDCEDPAFQENFEKLLEEEVDEVAVMDTVNALLRQMPDEDEEEGGLSRLPGKLTSLLIEKRVLERYRFEGEYLVAVDATRLASFSRKHCDRCLRIRHSNGEIEYFHAVLEAKIVTQQGLVFSLASVFIENPEDEEFDKQDCELKAFYRLAPILHKRFPRLPMCLLMDSLYANETVMGLCEKYRWSYCLAFKQGSIPNLYGQMLHQFECNSHNRIDLFHEDEQQSYEWACNLKHQGRELHAIRCSIRSADEQMTRFVFLTDHRPDEGCVRRIANCGGRQRSKIENQGFNIQKNHGYKLVKGYGYQGYAYKNIYHLTQIAHTIHQLIAYGDLNGKLARTQTQKQRPMASHAVILTLIAAAARAIDAFESVRAIAKAIGETFRLCILDDFAFTMDYARSIQIRFPPPDSS